MSWMPRSGRHSRPIRKMDGKLEVNWKTVRSWDNERRYDTVEELEARDFYEASTESVSGVMEWIRGNW